MKNKAFVKIAGQFCAGKIVTITCAMVFLLGVSAVQGAGSQKLRGHVPAVVAGLKPTGDFPGTNRLNLAIGLPLRNQEALTHLLREINNPASPRYHHYLTPEQFTEQFGPTEKDYQAVIAFAKANGLTITSTDPTRMLVDVNGSVADIERALHVTLRVYQHPTEKRMFHAPDAEPTLDLAVPILRISGLDNYSLPRPRLQATPLANASKGLPNAGSGPGSTYMGNDFRAAYVPDSSLNGSGQIVGLLQFDGYTASDITYYENQAGLPSITLSNVLIDGASGSPSGSGGEVEVSLDIEMAISMATNLSTVIVYMAPNPSPWEDLLNRMANDNLAKQLSCSWYAPGAGADTNADQIFQKMAAQGQSFFSASGDSDAYTGLIPFPGDTPYITQVGGTTLTTTGPGGSWVSETVWNWGSGIGSGGGISTQYPIPSWQTNINMTANQGSTTMRNTPDVALTADNVYVRADGLDYNVGGTSCAAPLWAGFAALVNQQAAASGKPAVGFINPAVDMIGSGPNFTTSFHDITTGNNTSSSSPTKFYAVSGYDLCTGWGTPAGQNLINALANPEALLIIPATGFASIGGAGGPFTITSQSLSLTNAGTNSLTWALANTSVWLNASPSGGILTPGGSATIVTVSLNTAASNLLVGTYNATVWFTNMNDSVGQGRQFTLAVISPPTITVQPTDQAVLEGATAIFTVGATGGLPLFYQWQDNGTNLTDSGNISGSTTASLTISSISPADAGTYSVIVTNVAGVVASSNALLTITPSPPMIVTQPTNQTVYVGMTVQFNVAALGSRPFSYQWNWNGTNIVGATNETLTLSNLQLTNSGAYSVTITNLLGSTTSSNAILTVNLPPPCLPPPSGLVAWWRGESNVLDSVGTNNGTSQNIAYTNGEVGQAFVFNGSGSSYIKIPASPSLDVGQSDGFTLELWCNPANTNFGTMTLVEWNNDSGTFTGMGVHMELLSGGQILGDIVDPNTGDDHFLISAYGSVVPNNWQHVAMTYDETTGLLTLYCNGVVVTNGNVGIWTPSTSFDLYFGIRPAGVAAPIPFAGSMDEISLYNRTLSSDEIAAIYAAGAEGKCYVPTPPVITTQPTNQTVAVGGTAAFTVVAGGTGPLSYQWGFGGTNIMGATNSVLTLTNVQLNQAGNYAVTVTNLYGSAVSSNAVLAVYTVPPFITTQPTNQTVVVGGTATFTVVAGGTAPLSYQWGFGGTNIVGATNSVLTLTNVQFSQAGNYAVIVTNAYGSVLSSNALLTVNPPPPCDPAPSGLVAWWRGESNALDSVGTNNGTPQNITYTNGEVGRAFVFNGSSSSYIKVPASPSLNVGQSNGFTLELWCNPVTTNASGVGVMTLAEWNNNSGSLSGIGCHLEFYNGGIILGDIVDPTGTDHSLQSPPGAVVSNNWQHVAMTYDKTTGLLALYCNGVVVTNGNVGIWTPSTSFDLYFGIRPAGVFAPIPYQGVLDEISLYNRVLSASEIQAIYAAGAAGKCYVPTPPVITTQPTNQTVAVGGTAAFTVVAGGTGPLSYQWGFGGTNIMGATNSVLTLTNVQLNQAGNYAVTVTNLYGSAVSSNAVLAVYTVPPFITTQPTNQTVVVGGTATFTVVAGGTAPLSYQWGFGGTNIVGATNSVLTLTNVQFSQAGNYAVIVTNAYGSVLSSNALLTVNPPPPCDPAPSGLVAWWRGESNALDSVGTNNGTPQNITYTNGEVGRAFGLNGSSSSYIKVPASPTLNVGQSSGFTIETWASPASTNAGTMTLVEWNNGSGMGSGIGSHLEFANGQILGDVVDPKGVDHFLMSASGNVVPNSWQHVAMTYDETTGLLALYCNGVVVTNGNVGIWTPSTSFNLYFGIRPAGVGAPLPYHGLLDEISLYNRALSSNEIAAIYAAGAAGKCPPTPPSITTQPTNQTVAVGGTAGFTVVAGGTVPLSCQWKFNGTNIAGATNTVLTLTNVQFSQSGNYAVTVTNFYGSAVSSNAVLTVTLDHFSWSPIPSPRFINTPFAVIIQARNLTNGLFTNFTATAILGTTNGVAVTPPVSGNFIQGVWTGSVVISQTVSNLVLRANDGLGHFGLANPINVISLPNLGMLRSGNIALYMWPVGYSGFVLETSGNLSPATWTPVPYSPIQIGDQYLLPLDMTGANGFYRLWFPGP